jgi:hypothetical protein
MNYAKFKEEFLIACDFIDEPVLSPETRLDQIPDFDSLAMLGVIVLLETHFLPAVRPGFVAGNKTQVCATMYWIELFHAFYFWM